MVVECANIKRECIMLEEMTYPFKRQNYYKGKQLTAQKMVNEQSYMNDKRRLLNTYLNGYGVVCGLDVMLLNESEYIKVQNGFAIDSMGREVVVDTDQIYNLNQIAGFSETTENELYLGIAYKEELTGEVYAPMCTDSEPSQLAYDEVKEGYQLCIRPASQVLKVKPIIESYVGETELYRDVRLCVKQCTPYFASRYEGLQIKVKIKNLSNTKQKFSLGYYLDLKGFRTKNGERYLQVTFDQVQLEAKGESVKTYQVFPSTEVENSSLQMKVGKDSFYIYEQCIRQTPLKRDFYFNIQVGSKTVWDWINTVYFAQALKEKQTKRKTMRIWLAAIKVARENGKVTITEIKKMPFNQYFYCESIFYVQAQLAEYYPSLMAESRTEKACNAVQPPCVQSWQKDNCATGVMVVPGDLPVGEVYVSEWVTPGLCKGPMYVEVGIEVPEEVEATDYCACMTIRGEGGLFNDLPKGNIHLKQAIKIDHENGRFQVAIQLLQTAPETTIRLRWYAILMI